MRGIITPRLYARLSCGGRFYCLGVGDGILRHFQVFGDGLYKLVRLIDRPIHVDIIGGSYNRPARGALDENDLAREVRGLPTTASNFFPSHLPQVEVAIVFSPGGLRL